jgi:23S rRNA (adenine2503-C2)-methyltransferase
MRVFAHAGRDDLAVVHLAEFADGRRVEFVESLQPPLTREEKWVLIVSTLAGCPVGCPMCDAGRSFGGRLTAEQILAQIIHAVRSRYSDGRVPAKKFKIQFARMGEPALNPAVLEVLEALPGLFDAPGLLPSLSTVAPRGCEGFFDRLLDLKERRYGGGRFQLQFSIHSTDGMARDRLIPVRKWDFHAIAAFGARWRKGGDQKITLNFALARRVPVDPQVLLEHFDPETFLVKVTPLNPTYGAAGHRLASAFDPHHPSAAAPLVEQFVRAGYRTILSIGETEENLIGSNCGQFLERHRRAEESLPDGYAYPVQPHG